MKYSLSLSIASLSVMLLTAATLAAGAAEEDRTDDVQHITVGTRMLSPAERVILKEERALREEKKEESSAEDRVEMKTKEAFTTSALHYSSHPGAFHTMIAVSAFGETVELEDGSIWKVRSSDTWKPLTWYITDSIVVVPNRSWFSIYDYCLVNENTGDVVDVNMGLGPVYNGPYTHWITVIDYYHNEVRLEDGSIWKISAFDSSTLKKWMLNDTVIIGINNGWLSSSKPNVLINVNMLEYVDANCFY